MNHLPKRLMAMLAALCLLMGGALGESMDEIMADLAGQDMQWTDQGQWTDETQWTDNTQWVESEPAAPTINMDADIRLGYVASGGGIINPFQCIDRDLVSLNQLMFESVVELDENLKPVPLLADSWKNEGKTWTFKLREGVVFHNGAELTAYEVVDSYNRFLLTDELNPYYSRVQMISSMTVVDNLTVQVESKAAGYVTLYAMTFPIVQSGTMDDAIARGTGPYWCTEYVQGLGLRLEANPLWWKNDPQVHSVAAMSFAETGDALQALETNQINMLCSQSSTAAFYRKFSDLTNMDYATFNFEMLVPNLSDDSPMGDVRMRQAVMYAIDRAAIASNAYLGMGVQCEVPVNPASWLYESQSAMYYYSPERALQLVRDCGWQDLTGDGMMNKINGVILEDLTVTILTYNEGTNSLRENAANMIAGYLEAVGINAEVDVRTQKKALSMIKEGEYDLALVGVQLSDVPDVSGILQARASLNLNSFRNEDMELLLSQVSGADETQLKSLYSQIQMLVVERLPVLGLVFRSGTVLSSRSLSGLSGLRAGNTLNGIEFMTK